LEAKQRFLIKTEFAQYRSSLVWTIMLCVCRRKWRRRKVLFPP